MKRILTIATLSGAVLLASHQAEAISVNAEAGSHYEGVNATQAFTPLFRGSLGYAHTHRHGHSANLYNASLMFTPWVPGLDVGVGGRYQYQHTHYGNGGGLGIGGYAYYPLPAFPLLSVGGDAYYTPSALSQGSAKESYEYDVRGRFKVFAQTYAFVGYHYQHSKFKNTGGHSFFNGPQIGVSVGF